MKKRYWIPGVLLVAMAVFLHLNLAQGKEVLAEIDSLVPLGKQEAAACTEWKQKVEAYPWSDVGAKDPPVHASKKEALAALEFLESYPGSPPSHLRAARLFRENRAALARRVDQLRVMGRWAQLEPECDIFYALRHTQALLQDIRAHKLAKPDAERAREAVRGYLKRERHAESLIASMIHIVILQKLHEENGQTSRAAAAKQLLDKAENERMKLSDEWKGRSRWWIFTVAGVDTELKLIGDLGQSYQGLLREAKL